MTDYLVHLSDCWDWEWLNGLDERGHKLFQTKTVFNPTLSVKYGVETVGFSADDDSVWLVGRLHLVSHVSSDYTMLKGELIRYGEAFEQHLRTEFARIAEEMSG